GNQPRGVNSPNYKHGIYSRYAGDSLAEVLDELEGKDPEELLNANSELKLLEALIISSDALRKGTGDIDEVDTLSKVVERLVKSRQRATALEIERNRLVPASDIELFLDFVSDTLRKFNGPDKSNEIMQQLKTFKISD